MQIFLITLTVVSLAAALVAGLIAWRLRRDEAERSDARVAALAAALDGPDTRIVPPLFEPGASLPRRHPLLKLAAGFAAVVGLIVVIASVGDVGNRAPDTGAVQPPRLALLSLAHEHKDRRLAVSGTVRNTGPAAARDVFVTVEWLDSSGVPLGQASAPLPARALLSGSTSSFQVFLPAGAKISRYRVGFRGELGVVRHVDLRGRPSAAPRS
jgi:hypothetical protein